MAKFTPEVIVSTGCPPMSVRCALPTPRVAPTGNPGVSDSE